MILVNGQSCQHIDNPAVSAKKYRAIRSMPTIFLRLCSLIIIPYLNIIINKNYIKIIKEFFIRVNVKTYGDLIKTYGDFIKTF